MTVEVVSAPYLRLRALAATLLVLLGTAAAHTWAGGHLPGLPVLVTLAGLVGAGSLLFLRGTASRRLLLPAVALAQAALHTGFAVLGPAGDHAGHAMTATAPGGTWSWSMLAAHALSTALTALAWWLCDRALLAVLTTRPLLGHLGARPRPVSRVPSPRRALPAHLLSAPRRGPPAAARCA